MATDYIFDWSEAFAIQNEVLKQSISGSSLKGILGKMTDELDKLNDGQAVTIFLKDREKAQLWPTAGSRIPPEWSKIVTPLPLGPKVGSCGTAGFLKKRVIVENILTDPLWEDFRHLQPIHGHMACWSQPILSPTEELLGTFAVYFKLPRSPIASELRLFESLALTVGVIIERKYHEQELIDSRNKAQAANRAKSVFLANMSHEIRTPMNAVLGYSQILKRERGLTDEQYTNVDAINRAGEHLLTLIDGVLEMSKIEAGRVSLDLAAFDFNGMLADLEMMFKLRAERAGIDLVVERTAGLPRYIEADEGKVRQVLINLMGNAIKFTQQGSLRVTPAVAHIQNGRVMLSVEVTDTGIGIAPEELESVFDAFEQTERGKSVAGGTGLGLAISRQYARLMGGDVVAVSRVGAGSTFTFTFEAQSTGAIASQTGRDQRRVVGLAEGQPPVRVLVVDDRHYNRDVLVKMLEPLGFEVETANDGAQAVSAFQRFAPHVVLMDIRMPVMDGVEASRTIRDLPGGDDVTILAVSASALEEQKKAVLERGADSFLSKPLREVDLFQALAEHAGVQFVYEEEKNTAEVAPEPGELATEALVALPRALLAQIVAATKSGDVRTLEGLSAQVEEADAALGVAFRALVNDFEYGRILTAVGPLIGDYEGND